MNPKIPGVAMTLGGREWIVPPVAIGPVKRLFAKFGLADGALPSRDPELAVQMLAAALRRNYPDITEETVAEELLDVSNIEEVMKAVMGIAGLQEKGPGEGEPRAPVALTGTGSTLT